MRKMCHKTAMSQMYSPRGQNSITKLKKVLISDLIFGFELSVVEKFLFNLANINNNPENGPKNWFKTNVVKGPVGILLLAGLLSRCCFPLELVNILDFQMLKW